MLLDQIHVDINIQEDMPAKEVARVKRFALKLDDKILRMVKLAMLVQRIDGTKVDINISR